MPPKDPWDDFRGQKAKSLRQPTKDKIAKALQVKPGDVPGGKVKNW